MALSIFCRLFILSYFCHSNPNRDKYTSMFSFGDSDSDTGNYVIKAKPTVPKIWINKPPYGETYFHNATGRCSDGRLIVDFIAQKLGLPLLPPYLSRRGDFRKGANFAVGQATAIETSFFQEHKLTTTSLLDTSLEVQLGWFDELKPSLCKTKKECKAYFSSSFFLFGEFGINDYVTILTGGKSLHHVLAYVPQVIQKISLSVEHVINQGAINIAVSGQLPIGCVPLFLTLFPSRHKHDYDPKTGCLRNFDYLALYHNTILQESLEKLRVKYPHVMISYADYYKPVLKLVNSPKHYGFVETPLRVCCGKGGKYNWNFIEICGMPGVYSCHNPPGYINWDGVHLTESAYHYIANNWLNGRFADPPFLSKKH